MNMQGPLMRHATSFGGGKSYISFPARNRQAAENSSANTPGDSRAEISDIRHTFSKVLYTVDTVTLYSKCTRALTFENEGSVSSP